MRITVPCNGLAPSAARGAVGTFLTDLGYPSAVDDAMLVASEVVTNAVIHGHCATTEVALTADGSCLRIAVGDPDASARPYGRPLDDTAISGRGMAIVAAIATEWGVDAGPAGKTVWAELPLPA